MPRDIALADRVRLAVAGETDPNERRKRVEEAISEHERDAERRALTAGSHKALVDNWAKGEDEPSPKPNRRRLKCVKCHECYPRTGKCQHGKIICWLHV